MPADLLVDALATHRLVRLIQRDTLPPLPEIRDHLHLVHGDRAWIELLHCPWCLSVHIAAAVTAARVVAPRWWGRAARVLAVSSLVGLVSERETN